MRPATWNWSRTNKRGPVSRLKEPRKGSKKRRDGEWKGDRHRSSSLLKAFKNLTLTTSSWMPINEVSLQGMNKPLDTRCLHRYNYTKTLPGDFVQLHQPRKWKEKKFEV